MCGRVEDCDSTVSGSCGVVEFSLAITEVGIRIRSRAGGSCGLAYVIVESTKSCVYVVGESKNGGGYIAVAIFIDRVGQVNGTKRPPDVYLRSNRESFVVLFHGTRRLIEEPTFLNSFLYSLCTNLPITMLLERSMRASFAITVGVKYPEVEAAFSLYAAIFSFPYY
jgi:hypothetical protein